MAPPSTPQVNGRPQNLGLPRRPDAPPGRGRREPRCSRAAACRSHCRSRIAPESGRRRQAACTPKAGLKPRTPASSRGDGNLVAGRMALIVLPVIKHALGAAINSTTRGPNGAEHPRGARPRRGATRGPPRLPPRRPPLGPRSHRAPPRQGATPARRHCHLQRGALNSSDSSPVARLPSRPPPRLSVCLEYPSPVKKDTLNMCFQKNRRV